LLTARLQSKEETGFLYAALGRPAARASSSWQPKKQGAVTHQGFTGFESRARISASTSCPTPVRSAGSCSTTAHGFLPKNPRPLPVDASSDQRKTSPCHCRRPH